jgi:hypothetical protein
VPVVGVRLGNAGEPKRLFRQREDAPKALEEYRAKQEATRNLIAKLRAERLAREAENAKDARPKKHAKARCLVR